MDHNFKGKKALQGKNLKTDYSRGPQSGGVTKKRKWIPANKFFSGSVQEGQGFAFNRKQKAQRQYSKLLRKEKWRMKDSKPKLTDSYPEHLRHLYMAEQERLDEEEQAKKNRRRKAKAADTDEDEAEDSSLVTGTADSVEKSASNEQPQSSQNKSSHKDLQRFTNKKMSSYQKSKQEFEKLKEERERKREEYLKDKAQREEALKKYKEKKQETYQLLKKKTKKGQPNLNLQMELLLQKIQSQQK